MNTINHISSKPLFLKVVDRNKYIEQTLFDIKINLESKDEKKYDLALKKLKFSKINVLGVLILKIVNFIVKIFKNKFNRIDILLDSNNKCKFFIKKISDLTNIKKSDSKNINNFKEFSEGNNSVEILSNFYLLQSTHYSTLYETLKTFEKILVNEDKKTSNKYFNRLPSYLKTIVKNLFAIEYPKIELEKNLNLLINSSEKSIISEILDVLLCQKDNYEKLSKNSSGSNNAKIHNSLINNDFFIQILLGNKINKKDFVYDVSVDGILKKVPQSILNNPITITMVGVEYAGIIKQGGLAEAIEGLCRGLKEQNSENQIQIILPKYSPLPDEIDVNMGIPQVHVTAKGKEYRVYEQIINGIKIYFIEDKSFQLDNQGIYSNYQIMSERFGVFSELAAELIYEMKNSDVIHLHDWHVSGIALKLKKDHKDEWKKGEIPPIIFTYHNNNRNSQGRVCLGPYSYDPVITGYQNKGIISNNDNLFIKALKICDSITTVSESFAKESQTESFGEGISFAVRGAAKIGKLTGILNGTDSTRWNPETNEKLKNFRDVEANEIIDLSYGVNSNNLALKRNNAKNQLQKWIKVFFPNIKIDLTKPLVTFIGRYDSMQKGLDKFEEAIRVILKNGGQFLSIGISPDSEATKILDKIEKEFSEGVFIIRDSRTERGLLYQDGNESMPGIGPLIRASSDFIFIPSSFEPCGLTQFEGWLFGSLAIASNTGGLSDSIITYSADANLYNGFLFDRDSKDNSSLSKVLENVLTLWNSLNDDAKSSIMKRLMEKGKQYTWSKAPYGLSPTQKYRLVYENAKKRSLNRTIENPLRKMEQLKNKIPFKRETKNKVSKSAFLEEQYLADYYSKKCDSEKLDLLYQNLDDGFKFQVPVPYGRKVIVNHYEKYGALLSTEGATFILNAPNAKKIQIVLVNEEGKIQGKHPLNKAANGDWTISLPNIKEGQNYFYNINGKRKIDPYARSFNPSSKFKIPLSVVTQNKYLWNDNNWIKERELKVLESVPISVFELHPGYWKRKNGEVLNYRELAVHLSEYCHEMGYTHVELMGILEYPTENSWGYQVTGYYAPTSRYGSLDDFKYMVDFLHQNKIGIILDWIPAHFAQDDFGLSNFDDSNLYEASGFKYALSIRKKFFSYGSKHFNYKSKKVREFLFSSAIYWLKEMHIDCLRIDCVRSILESEDKKSAHLFLRDLNAVVHKHAKGCYTIAEDFSGDRRMTASFANNGFEFDRKWHAGWMNGSINYFRKNYKKRKTNYAEIIETVTCDNFSRQMMFISHDQVKSEEYQNLINLFPNCKNEQDKFKNLRIMLSFMMCLPGKKLIFMGEDSGLNKPWDKYVNTQNAIQDDIDATSIETIQTQKMIKALNQIYKTEKAMHEFDDNGDSLEWIKDKKKIVHAYRRKSSNGDSCVILHNFINVEAKDFKIKLSSSENKLFEIKQIFTTEEDGFGVSTYKELTILDNTYTVTVPPLSTIIIKEKVTSN